MKRDAVTVNQKLSSTVPRTAIHKKLPVAITDNRQKVGNRLSTAARPNLTYCFYWHPLGEAAGDFRNADKSERNRITCRLSDTTGGYHRQSSDAVIPQVDPMREGKRRDFRYLWCIVLKASLHSTHFDSHREPTYDHSTRRLQLRTASPYD
jgi:hypothetical protein